MILYAIAATSSFRGELNINHLAFCAFHKFVSEFRVAGELKLQAAGTKELQQLTSCSYLQLSGAPSLPRPSLHRLLRLY
jgi:hypothetical protein